MPKRAIRLSLEILDRRDLPTSVPIAPLFATGAGIGGGPHVKVWNQMFVGPLHEFFAYSPGFLGGVRVATGDVTGDRIEDIVTVPGPGGGPHVRVFDGRFGRLISEFFAFPPSYSGGLFVTTADVNGDGVDEIAVSGSPGSLPVAEVRVFRVDGIQYSGSIGQFFPFVGFSGQQWSGGCALATLDLNLDLRDDIVVGAPDVNSVIGAGIRVFDAVTAIPSRSIAVTSAVGNPFGRVYVAAGDVTNDQIGDIVYSVSVAGANTGSSTQVLSGGLGLSLVRSFGAYPGFAGASVVAVSNLNRTGPSEIVTGAGFGGQPLVKFYRFDDISSNLPPAGIVPEFWPFQAYDNFGGGVWIG